MGAETWSVPHLHADLTVPGPEQALPTAAPGSAELEPTWSGGFTP